MAEVRGGRRHFSARAVTSCPERVWQAWTSPSTWGSWDRGLVRAWGVEPFEPGATGQIEDLHGRRSRMTVIDVQPGTRCAVEVHLPSAALVLVRTLDRAAHPAGLCHEVLFRGPLGPVWALLLGGGFRARLAPTVDALLVWAEQQEPT